MASSKNEAYYSDEYKYVMYTKYKNHWIFNHERPDLKEYDPTRVINEPVNVIPGISQILNSTSGSAIDMCYNYVKSRHFVYVTERGRWFYYDGSKWVEDFSGEGWIIRTLAGFKDKIFEVIAENQAAVEADPRYEKDKSKLYKKISALFSEERNLRAVRSGVSMSFNDFDQHLDLVCFPNGYTLNLETASIRRSRPEDFITRVTGVDWPTYGPLDPMPIQDECPCPMFWRFLSEIMVGEDGKPDAALFNNLLYYMGHFLSGVNETVLHIWFGQGKNGKTVLFKILEKVLGDYACTTANDVLLKGGAKSTHDAFLMHTRGRRLVGVQETNVGDIVNESKVKRLTGGDTIATRGPNDKGITIFTPQASWIIATNHKPDIKGVDRGVWRRILVTPFFYTVPSEKENPRIAEEILEKEGPKILQFLASCAFRYYLRGGYPEVSEVQKRVIGEYKDTANPLLGWINDYVDVTRNYSDDRIDLNEFYSAYSARVKEDGHNPISKSRMQKSLESMDMKIIREKNKDGSRRRVVGGAKWQDLNAPAAHTLKLGLN